MKIKSKFSINELISSKNVIEENRKKICNYCLGPHYTENCTQTLCELCQKNEHSRNCSKLKAEFSKRSTPIESNLDPQRLKSLISNKKLNLTQRELLVNTKSNYKGSCLYCLKKHNTNNCFYEENYSCKSIFKNPFESMSEKFCIKTNH